MRYLRWPLGILCLLVAMVFRFAGEGLLWLSETVAGWGEAL
jgi:hypothetical protein